MVDRAVRMNMLYDTYGNLLTDRQREFFALYYQDDMSLGEIAQAFGVSRQAVHDTLRRAEAALTAWEARLDLLAREARRRRLLLACRADVSAMLDAAGPGEVSRRLRGLDGKLSAMLDLD